MRLGSNSLDLASGGILAEEHYSKDITSINKLLNNSEIKRSEKRKRLWNKIGF